MIEPRWLRLEEIIVAHERQLARFGGAPGIREEGALESALSRARNKWTYEQCGVIEFAASYAFGIARNHPFVDGDKRVAFIAMALFLRLNGVPFAPPQDESAAAIFDVAAGELDEKSLARWIGDRLP